jgi:hypothetical protein
LEALALQEIQRCVVLKHLAKTARIDGRAAVRARHECSASLSAGLSNPLADVPTVRGFDQAMGHSLAPFRFTARVTDAAAARFGIARSTV